MPFQAIHGLPIDRLIRSFAKIWKFFVASLHNIEVICVYILRFSFFFFKYFVVAYERGITYINITGLER